MLYLVLCVGVSVNYFRDHFSVLLHPQNYSMLTTTGTVTRPNKNKTYKHVSVALLTYLLLFLWIFPSCRVAGITDDISSPHHPVRLLARSQSSTFQISFTRVFPSCFRIGSFPGLQPVLLFLNCLLSFLIPPPSF